MIREPRPETPPIHKSMEGKLRKIRSQRQNSPIEEKESIRWIEGLRAADEMASAMPEVSIICVADSEADIHEYLSHSSEPKLGQMPEATLESLEPRRHADWIVRACQDRVLLVMEDELLQQHLGPLLSSSRDLAQESACAWKAKKNRL